jgi:hypothetical protein
MERPRLIRPPVGAPATQPVRLLTAAGIIRHMATTKRRPLASKAGQVRGTSVATLSSGLVLVRVGAARKSRAAARGAGATELLNKAARAFAKPGFDRQVIFGSGRNGKVFAYSVFPDDPSKIIREAADGTRTIGRLVGGRFRPSRAA